MSDLRLEQIESKEGSNEIYGLDEEGAVWRREWYMGNWVWSKLSMKKKPEE